MERLNPRAIDTSGGSLGDVLTIGTSGDLEYGSGTAAGGSGGTVADALAAHRFLLAAHRGDIGSADSYPENTVEAFRQAARKGVEVIETDVQQSADGTWWIMHDTTVDRTTNGSGSVASKTDAQMAALSIDGGYGYSAARHGTSLRVPTLAQAFTALEQYGAFMIPELKGGDPVALAEFVDASGMGARIVLEIKTAANAALVKGYNSSLTTLAGPVSSGLVSDPNVDWTAVDVDTDLPSLATAQSWAPLNIKAYAAIGTYGSDEAARVEKAWNYGARIYQGTNVDQLLEVRERLIYTARHLAAADPHAQYQRKSEKGAANGYASLGADGKVPSAQLPAGLGGGGSLVPLTTVVGGVPELVWEADNSLSLTEVPL